MPKKLTQKEFIEKAQKIYSDEYDYSEVEYINSHTKVKIKCNKCNKYFYIRPNNHLSANGGCQRCNIKKVHEAQKLSCVGFIERMLKKFGNTFIYPFLNNEFINGLQSRLTVKCKICGCIFNKKVYSLLKNGKCPFCFKQELSKPKLTQEEFLKRAKIIHGDLYDYSLVIYKGIRKHIIIICNKCKNSFIQLPCNHLQGKGCPYCKMSKGELTIMKYLNDKKIDYVREYKFKNCKNKKPLPFDFYLPAYNTCIEFQGGQHYTMFRFEKNDLCLKQRQSRDQIKRDYCKLNNITLLEIKYNDNIKEKLDNFLRS